MATEGRDPDTGRPLRPSMPSRRAKPPVTPPSYISS